MTSIIRGRSWGAGIGTLVIHALIGWVLLAGRGVAVPRHLTDDPLIVLDITPPSPQPPPKRRKPVQRAHARGAPKRPVFSKIEGAAILMSQAPPPLIIIASPVLNAGGLAANGAGDTGSGSGSGRGPGEAVEGTGNNQRISPARQIRGRFRNSDFPAAARAANRLRIGVRYTVNPAGRVAQCEIIDSSGYPEVDAMTCRVISDRYHFRPARDGDGVAITEVMEEDYTWVRD